MMSSKKYNESKLRAWFNKAVQIMRLLKGNASIL